MFNEKLQEMKLKKQEQRNIGNIIDKLKQTITKHLKSSITTSDNLSHIIIIHNFIDSLKQEISSKNKLLQNLLQDISNNATSELNNAIKYLHHKESFLNEQFEILKQKEMNITIKERVIKGIVNNRIKNINNITSKQYFYPKRKTQIKHRYIQDDNNYKLSSLLEKIITQNKLFQRYLKEDKMLYQKKHQIKHIYRKANSTKNIVKRNEKCLIMNSLPNEVKKEELSYKKKSRAESAKPKNKRMNNKYNEDIKFESLNISIKSKNESEVKERGNESIKKEIKTKIKSTIRSRMKEVFDENVIKDDLNVKEMHSCSNDNISFGGTFGQLKVKKVNSPPISRGQEKLKESHSAGEFIHSKLHNTSYYEAKRSNSFDVINDKNKKHLIKNEISKDLKHNLIEINERKENDDKVNNDSSKSISKKKFINGRRFINNKNNKHQQNDKTNKKKQRQPILLRSSKRNEEINEFLDSILSLTKKNSKQEITSSSQEINPSLTEKKDVNLFNIINNKENQPNLFKECLTNNINNKNDNDACSKNKQEQKMNIHNKLYLDKVDNILEIQNYTKINNSSYSNNKKVGNLNYNNKHNKKGKEILLSNLPKDDDILPEERNTFEQALQQKKDEINSNVINKEQEQNPLLYNQKVENEYKDNFLNLKTDSNISQIKEQTKNNEKDIKSLHIEEKSKNNHKCEELLSNESNSHENSIPLLVDISPIKNNDQINYLQPEKNQRNTMFENLQTIPNDESEIDTYCNKPQSTKNYKNKIFNHMYLNYNLHPDNKLLTAHFKSEKIDNNDMSQAKMKFTFKQSDISLNKSQSNKSINIPNNKPNKIQQQNNNSIEQEKQVEEQDIIPVIDLKNEGKSIPKEIHINNIPIESIKECSNISHKFNIANNNSNKLEFQCPIQYKYNTHKTSYTINNLINTEKKTDNNKNKHEYYSDNQTQIIGNNHKDFGPQNKITEPRIESKHKIEEINGKNNLLAKSNKKINDSDAVVKKLQKFNDYKLDSNNKIENNNNDNRIIFENSKEKTKDNYNCNSENNKTEKEQNIFHNININNKENLIANQVNQNNPVNDIIYNIDDNEKINNNINNNELGKKHSNKVGENNGITFESKIEVTEHPIQIHEKDHNETFKISYQIENNETCILNKEQQKNNKLNQINDGININVDEIMEETIQNNNENHGAQKLTNQLSIRSAKNETILNVNENNINKLNGNNTKTNDAEIEIIEKTEEHKKKNDKNQQFNQNEICSTINKKQNDNRLKETHKFPSISNNELHDKKNQPSINNYNNEINLTNHQLGAKDISLNLNMKNGNQNDFIEKYLITETHGIEILENQEIFKDENKINRQSKVFSNSTKPENNNNSNQINEKINNFNIDLIEKQIQHNENINNEINIPTQQFNEKMKTSSQENLTLNNNEISINNGAVPKKENSISINKETFNSLSYNNNNNYEIICKRDNNNNEILLNDDNNLTSNTFNIETFQKQIHEEHNNNEININNPNIPHIVDSNIVNEKIETNTHKTPNKLLTTNYLETRVISVISQINQDKSTPKECEFLLPSQETDSQKNQINPYNPNSELSLIEMPYSQNETSLRHLSRQNRQSKSTHLMTDIPNKFVNNDTFSIFSQDNEKMTKTLPSPNINTSFEYLHNHKVDETISINRNYIQESTISVCVSGFGDESFESRKTAFHPVKRPYLFSDSSMVLAQENSICITQMPRRTVGPIIRSSKPTIKPGIKKFDFFGLFKSKQKLVTPVIKKDNLKEKIIKENIKQGIKILTIKLFRKHIFNLLKTIPSKPTNNINT